MRDRFLLAAALLLFGSFAWASGPYVWVQAGAEDFSAGEADAIAVSADGRAVLGPALELVVDAGVPRIWSFASDPAGNLYGSWGEEGEIHRVAVDGSREVIARLQQVAAQAMVWGPDGHLYVAAGPEAVIYRIAPSAGSEPERWFETGTRYVWAMRFDEAGALWLATGGDGRIVRVSGAGDGTVVYDSPEPHVTALTIAPDGTVLAGTEGHGYIYRIAADGTVFVLFDAPQREITDLLWQEGEIFAAAFGNGANEQEGSDAAASGPVSRKTADAATKASGAVYRIASDGLVEAVWTSEAEGPYALAQDREGGLVVATGPDGRLLRLEGRGVGLFSDLEAAQVVGLESTAAGLLVATSNPGRVHRAAARYAGDGRLVSQVHDAGATASWGAVRWTAEVPDGAALAIETRSGNTEIPDDTWSAWQAVSSPEGASRSTSPPARFVQWRASLTSAQPDRTPSLTRVEIALVVRNLPPRVDSLTVHPGGVVFRQNSSFDDGMPFAQVPPAIARQIESNGAGAAVGGSSFLGRPYYVAGLRTFSWESSDPNDDALRFTLLVRGEGESEWKPVARELVERMLVLDTRRLPDGPYYARLSVSDAASRPAGDAREGTRDSGAFVIDNTPPVLSGLSLTPGRPPMLRALAEDVTSLIAGLEYSVDGGDWRTVRPRDGVADDAREALEVALGSLAAGEHTAIVRATDTAQNEGTAKIVFVVDETGEVEGADE